MAASVGALQGSESATAMSLTADTPKSIPGLVHLHIQDLRRRDTETSTRAGDAKQSTTCEQIVALKRDTPLSAFRDKLYGMLSYKTRLQGLRRRHAETSTRVGDAKQSATCEQIVTLERDTPLSALWDKLYGMLSCKTGLLGSL